MIDARAYIPEVDGLRALAVTAVVLFHGFPSLVPGGFVGVDIFFVISGFVIGRSYLDALIAQQTSLAYFYLKRVRRLGAPYVLVLAISSPVALLVLPPILLREYGEALVGQPIYIQNIIFWYQGDYFKLASSMPLLHTWSLAIEEQFYLLFGLLVVLARKRRGLLIPLLLAAFLASLALGVFISQSSPKTSFYWLPTRVWEFAAGIFAYLVSSRLSESPAGALAKGCSLLSIVGLVYSLLGFSEGSPFPGVQTFLAVSATASLLILFENRPTHMYRPFSVRPVRYLGDISYSLYLWHWPVFVFAGLGFDRRLSWAESLVAVGFSTVLASLTFRYLENPVRTGRWYPTSRGLVGRLALSSAFFILLGSGLILSQGAVFRFPEPVRTWHLASQDRPSLRCSYLTRITHPTSEACRINRETGRPGVLLMGDSYANQIKDVVARVGEAYGVPVFITVRTCDFDERGVTAYCNEGVFENLLNETDRLGIGALIVSSSWGSSSLDYRIFESNLLAFSSRGIHVYFVEDPPTGAVFDPMARASVWNRGEPVPESFLPLSEYLEAITPQRSMFGRLKGKYPKQVSVLTPLAYVCEEAGCPFETNGYPNYFDASHLTPHGAKRLEAMFYPVFAWLH